jgi:DNA-binding MarR family transcriptional regulator
VSKERIPGDKAPLKLAFLLSQVGVYSSRRFAQRIAAVDLDPPHFRILNIVDAAEGLAQQAIGETIEVPPSRMVALVDELERRDLIERRPDPADRRIRALYLTDEGRKRLARGRKVASEHEEELTLGMSAADRERLTALLRGIVEEQGLGHGIHPGLSDPGGA